jgi:hypothetical protein
VNLVLVHGRAQGGKEPATLKDAWLVGLKRGFRAAKDHPQLDVVQFPFYGDRLDQLVRQLSSTAEAVLDRGAPATTTPVDPFTAAFVQQLADRAGVDRDAALAGLTTVERGPERWEVVRALLRKVEQKAPWVAHLAIGRYTADVKVYLENSFVRSEINNIVLAAMQEQPLVVVAHSLGTIVAYVVLREHPEIRPRLFLTAGSPLGLDVIRDNLPVPRAIPADRWLNVSDDDDIVALFPKLDERSFVDGIDNITDIDNGDEPHSIVRYLSDERVGHAIATALSAGP